jgi:hypothetical protein
VELSAQEPREGIAQVAVVVDDANDLRLAPAHGARERDAEGRAAMWLFDAIKASWCESDASTPKGEASLGIEPYSEPLLAARVRGDRGSVAATS